MIRYTINKGLGKPIEFKGFKGQYIVYMLVGLGLAFLVFAMAYMTGVSMLVCLGLAGSVGTGIYLFVSRLNATYGEHGLMKQLARRQVPRRIVLRNRKIFTKLNK